MQPFDCFEWGFSAYALHAARRFLQSVARKSLLVACMLFSLSGLSVQAAEAIDITQAHIESTDEGYKLSAGFSFDLNHVLEDVLTHGVPLFFTTEVEMTRPRWYWFDEKTIIAAQTIRISYNVLTRQYHAAIVGGVQQSFATLEDALLLVRRPSRWVVAEKNALTSGAIYKVAIRMYLNLEFAPKPIQVTALNNSDWRLASEWKKFSFKAD
jgi:Domain of unknown function (DUF4390)